MAIMCSLYFIYSLLVALNVRNLFSAVVAGQTIAITGVQNGVVSPRLEIRQLQQNSEMFNIYLLALGALQQIDSSDNLSYYQIAGIHGMPFQAWDGVQQCSTCADDGWGGYCMHNDDLFPFWHRPYVALFEQQLQLQAVTIASQFEDSLQAGYVAAANALRAPYWDWAMIPTTPGENNVPDILTAQSVTVQQPTGQNETIPNPLYSYVFNGDFSMLPLSMSSDSTTVRSPTYVQDMNNAWTTLRSSLYQMFSQTDNYTQFSTEAVPDSTQGNPHYNIEAIHGIVHTNVGGGQGHMAYFESSAFDPSFMLHHTMVDRCLALWQVITSDTVGNWLVPEPQNSGTWAMPSGFIADGSTPLWPFHTDTSGDFWTSNYARDVTFMGYTYPELEGNFTPQTISAIINQLYGNGTPGAPSLSTSKRDLFDRKALDSELLAINNLVTDQGTINEYSAIIGVQAMALPSFSVSLFSGPFDHSSPSTWSSSSTFMGSQAFFQATSSRPMKQLLISGPIPLTNVLMDAVKEGKLSGMSNDEVASFLKDNLEWGVSLANGTVVEDCEVPGFSISVSACEVTPASSVEEFPLFGQWESLEGVGFNA